MKMKYLIGSFLSLMISASAFAQNPGADYLSLGEIKLAKEYLSKQSSGDASYYLGEIAYKEGNIAQAKSLYEQGAATSALASVGQAKLQLKSSPKEADSQLKEIFKKNKKDVTLILAIAKAYSDNGMKDKALEKVADAKKADKKSPYPFIFEGDMLAKENKPGDAAGQYDQAIYVDANCALAYIKGAQVYEHINMKTATDLLNKAIQISPDYKFAYKNLADLCYNNGFYPDAVNAYREFIAGGNYTVDDLRRYAASEYFTDNYEGARKLINEGLTRDANNFALNRLLMYSSEKLKDYETGVKAGDKFFSIPLNPKDTIQKYLVSDYMSYATVLNETGNKTKAIEQYEKAIALDPSKVSLYKDIATTCARENLYPAAAQFYKKYIESSKEVIDATDYYQLGNYYLSAGSNIEDEAQKAQKIEFYKQADVAFGKVAELKPESYLGFYQRARVNYQLDPDSEQGLAKPYYEKTIEVILASGDDNKKVLTEAYSYLSYYYYLQFDKHKKADDKVKVKEYADKVLGIDPENNAGKQLSEWANSK